MKRQIYYYKGNYKYQLGLDEKIQLPFKIEANLIQSALDTLVVKHEYFTITASGLLTIKAGYAWDGASGPTFDTSDSMRASLYHDVGYQAIGEKLLPMSYRVLFDELLLSTLIEDGMLDFRAHAWYKAVRAFGYWPAKNNGRVLMAAPLPASYPTQQKFGMA